MKLRKRLYMIYRIKGFFINIFYYSGFYTLVFFLVLLGILYWLMQEKLIPLLDKIFDWGINNEDRWRYNAWHKSRQYKIFDRKHMSTRITTITEHGRETRRKALKRGW